jgi:hypothetical protein
MYLAEWDAFAAQVQRGSNAAVAAQAMGHAGLFMCPGSVGQKSLGCSSIYRKWPKLSRTVGCCFFAPFGRSQLSAWLEAYL